METADYNVQIDISVNQGFSCDSSKEDRCCRTTESCFVGDLSGITKQFIYFDDGPVESEIAISLPENTMLHAHLFEHGSHYLSSSKHAHVALVNGELVLARSITESRLCQCLLGDFDCICFDSEAGVHSHVFVHDDANAGVNHSHLIMVRTPAIGIPKQISPNSSQYLAYPLLPIYGVGKYDTIPEDAFGEIVDISTIENSLIPSVGTEIRINLFWNLTEGTSINAILDGRGSIELPSHAGSTGEYKIEISGDPANFQSCQLSAQYCKQVFSRSEFTVANITDPIFSAATIKLTSPFTGSISRVAINIINSVSYPVNCTLIFGFPRLLQFLQPLNLLICDSYDQNCRISDRNSEVSLIQSQVNNCPHSFMCLGILYKNGLAESEGGNYIVGNFQMPDFPVQLGSSFWLLSVDEKNNVIEVPSHLIPFPFISASLLPFCSGNLSNLTAGSTSNATFHMILGSDLVPGNVIQLSFPNYFQAQATEIEVSWSSEGFNVSNWTSISVSTSFKRSSIYILIPSDSKEKSIKKGSSIQIICSSIENSGFPEQSYTFAISLLSSNFSLESNCSLNIPPLLPAVLTSAKATLGSLNTGVKTDLNISFISTTPIIPGSDIVVSLPDGFALWSDTEQGLIKVAFSEGLAGINCSLTVCPKSSQSSQVCSVPRCDPAQSNFMQDVFVVSLGLGCKKIYPQSLVSFQVSSVRNVLVEGPYQQVGIYVSIPGMCNICAYAKDVEWQQGMSDVFLQTSTLLNAAVNMDVTRTGGSGNITLSFYTVNYLPKESWVVIDVPQYFQFNRSKWTLGYLSSDPLGNVRSGTMTASTCCNMTAAPNISFSCCTNTQLIFFKISNVTLSGTLFRIQIAGINNTLLAGNSVFQVRTASALWSFVDRVKLNVTISPTSINASVTPVSYLYIQGDGTVNEILSNQLFLAAQGTFIVSLTTKNIIPSNGGLVVNFSYGFDVSKALLLGSVQGLSGAVGVSTDSSSVFINRYNGSDSSPVSNITFKLTNIVHPSFLGRTYFNVRTLAQKGAQACFTCNSFSVSECDLCNNYGTIDDSGIFGGGVVGTGQLLGLSVLLAPISYPWLYIGVFASFNVSFSINSSLSPLSSIVIDLPANFSSKVPITVQTSSFLAIVNTSNTSAIVLTIRTDQALISAGSQLWVFVSGVQVSTFPLNITIFNVRTTNPGCTNSNCVLQAGSAQATCLLPDFDSLASNQTFSQVFASVSALAATPTKNVSYGVTLFWNLATKISPSMKIVPYFSAQVLSNFSSNWTYKFTYLNGISGRYYVDPRLLQGFKGSVVNFNLAVNGVNFGVAYALIQSSSSAPQNFSAKNSGSFALNVSWTAPADQGIGYGRSHFLTAYVIDFWRQNFPNATTISRTITCCSSAKGCCGISSIILTDAVECSRGNLAVPCISADFTGKNITLRIRAFNAAGGGVYSANITSLIVGTPDSLVLSAQEYAGQQNGSGIRLLWSAPAGNFDYGFGPGVSSVAFSIQYEIQVSNSFDATTWVSVATLPSNVTQYCYCTGLISGLTYLFRIRVLTKFANGVFVGNWSSIVSLQAIQKPTATSIVDVASFSGCRVRIYVHVQQDVEIISPDVAILGFYVLQMEVTDFEPCCQSTNISIQCADSNLSGTKAFAPSLRFFSVSAEDGTLWYEPVALDPSVPVKYVFEVSAQSRGKAFRYQVLGYNSAGNASSWSEFSPAVQCQSSTLPAVEVSAPVLGNLTATLYWDVFGSPLNYTSDFVYQVSLDNNATYPFGGYFPEGSSVERLTAPLWSAKSSLGSDSSSMQSLRTFGAKDLDFVEVGGTIYLAVANSKAFTSSDSSSLLKLSPGNSFLEASMVFVWNATTKSFGGNCQWNPGATTTDCQSIGPLCAGFSKSPVCLAAPAFTAGYVLLPSIGAQQLIQTFGAVKVKFMVLDGATYLMVLNSMNPNSSSLYYCFDSSTGYPVKVLSNSGTYSLEPKTIIADITTCTGRTDDQSCKNSFTTAVCRPGAFQTNNVFGSTAPSSNGTNGSYSVLYKLDTVQQLFLEYSFFLFQRPRYIESFSAAVCYPINNCHVSNIAGSNCPVCIAQSSACACKNTSFMFIADAGGSSVLFSWDSTAQHFVEFQAFQTSSATAARFFQTENESLLVIANGQNGTSSNIAAHTSVFRLENGLFQMITSVLTYGANHVEHFAKDGRHFLVICSGIDQNFDNNNVLDRCVPNITCPLMYEWKSGSLNLFQSFDDFYLNQALSSTAFTRVENNVLTNYLLFANNRSSSQNASITERGAFSYLYRWTTTINVWGAGEILYDGLALVHQVYTLGAQKWSIFQSRGFTFAGVANFVEDAIDTSSFSCNNMYCLLGKQCTQSNPSGCLQQSCNYRARGSCCETAGAPCIVNDNPPYYFPYLKSSVTIAELGVSSIYNLSGWPLYSVQSFGTCTNNTITLHLPQSAPGQPDFKFYGADNLVSVYTTNQFGTGVPTQIPIRPLRTPGAPSLISVQQHGPLAIAIQFAPPIDDGEIRKAFRSTVVMGFRVVVIKSLLLQSTFPNCEFVRCTFDVYTTSTSFLAENLQKAIQYSFFVSAVNAAGEGPVSEELRAVAYDSPSPVNNASAQPTLGPLRIYLKWNAPADLGCGNCESLSSSFLLRFKLFIYRSDGSSLLPVTDYTSEPWTGGTIHLNLPEDLDEKRFSFEKGVQYDFDILAVTDAGQSQPVRVSACALTRSDPAILLSARPTAPAQITLTWYPPYDIGAGPGKQCLAQSYEMSNSKEKEDYIMLYAIEISLNSEFVPLVKINGSDLFRCNANVTSMSIGGLRVGTIYYFRIFVETVPGTSLPSNVLSSFAVGLPSIPTNIQISRAGPFSLAIRCNIPDNTGLGLDKRGFKLTSIQVELSEDSGFVVQDTYSLMQGDSEANITISGLKAGVTYFSRIKAVNVIGSSPYSSILDSIPLNVPASPQNFMARTKMGFSIEISWQVSISPCPFSSPYLFLLLPKPEILCRIFFSFLN